jgi:hypothetical protein
MNKYLNIEHKLLNCNTNIHFNRTCIVLKLIPKYIKTKIKPYNKAISEYLTGKMLWDVDVLSDNHVLKLNSVVLVRKRTIPTTYTIQNIYRFRISQSVRAAVHECSRGGVACCRNWSEAGNVLADLGDEICWILWFGSRG